MKFLLWVSALLLVGVGCFYVGQALGWQAGVGLWAVVIGQEIWALFREVDLVVTFRKMLRSRSW